MLDPVKSSLEQSSDRERSCQLSISKSRLIKAIRLRKSSRFIETSRGPLTSNRCQTQPEKRPTNAHTYTHKQNPRADIRTCGEKEGRKGSSGSLSPGNTPNSRYIQAEPTINLVPRRRAEVGAEVRAKSHEGRAREVEGRAGERKRGGFNQNQKASGATDYCLQPTPFASSSSLSFSTPLRSPPVPVLSSSAYPSPGLPWLAHEVNNHQKSQCLSRAAALCAPTRAPDANTTPPGLYYELLELLHRRRIFTCSASAHLRSRACFFCISFAFFHRSNFFSSLHFFANSLLSHFLRTKRSL